MTLNGEARQNVNILYQCPISVVLPAVALFLLCVYCFVSCSDISEEQTYHFGDVIRPKLCCLRRDTQSFYKTAVSAKRYQTALQSISICRRIRMCNVSMLTYDAVACCDRCSCCGSGVRRLLGSIPRATTTHDLHPRRPVDRRSARDTVYAILRLRQCNISYANAIETMPRSADVDGA